MAMAGLPLPLVEVRARVGDEEIPWDGEAMGELEVRGPWVASSYYDTPEQADRWTDDGWFKTGDIVSLHPRGFIQIKDRSKDVIKSGGEWISSVELENALMAHPSVAEAAVIAIPDPKWDERPLAAVVLKPGASASADELREFLAPNFAKWWLPERFEFVEEIPKTSVGKFRKTALREQFAQEPAQDLRAALLREVDGPFELGDVPEPAADGKVLVRVRAAGINFADVHGAPRAVPADAGAPGGDRLRDRRRARGRDARDGDHVGRRRLRGAGRRRTRAGRAAARSRVVRRGRVVPPDVSDGAHPADAAGARSGRDPSCSCTRPPAASARRRSRWRERSARA